MGLLLRIDEEFKSAMKQNNSTKVSVLRLLKSAISYKQIDKGSSLTEEEILLVINKEAKQRHESIVAYRGKRNDLADQEQRELQILETYLPENLSDEKIKEIIDQILDSVHEKNNIGQIMGMVMRKLKGQRVDGNNVKKLVLEKLKG